MASWTHDVRPMALVEWGLHHNEISNNAVIPEDTKEVRPSCILATGTEVGEE